MCDSKTVFQILALQEQESSRVAEMRSELESCQRQNAELQKQVNFLQDEADSAFKALENSNKAIVCELGEKLRREKRDCQELRKQLLVSAADRGEAVLKFTRHVCKVQDLPSSSAVP
jgi:chromosome segregation ATPase